MKRRKSINKYTRPNEVSSTGLKTFDMGPFYSLAAAMHTLNDSIKIPYATIKNMAETIQSEQEMRKD